MRCVVERCVVRQVSKKSKQFGLGAGKGDLETGYSPKGVVVKWFLYFVVKKGEDNQQPFG